MIEEQIIVDSDTSLEESRDEILPAVIRSEVNFLQFPFFALSWRGLKEKKETIYKYTEERDGEKAELEWRVMASATYGHPTPFDRTVARAFDAHIDEVLKQYGYPLENPVKFSVYRIGQLLGHKKVAGSTHKKIKEAMERIVSATVKSKGSFFLKDKTRRIDRTFHPYEEVIFFGEEMDDGTNAETNYLKLHDFFLRNINSRHVRPLDYQYLTSLDSDLASRLYELLSGKFYGLPSDKHYLRIGYNNLCQALPITPQKYYSMAKQKLKSAHEELIRTGFLSKVTYQRYKGKQDFNVLYYLGERAKKELSGDLQRRSGNLPIEEQLLIPLMDTEPKKETPLTGIALELQKRGVSKTSAQKLANTHDAPYTTKKIAIFDSLREFNDPLISENPAGWLRRAIEQDFELSDEQKKKAQAHAQEKAEDDRRERWSKHREKLIDEKLKNWDKNLEEHIESPFERWLMRITTVEHREPSEKEIEAKKRELKKEFASKTKEERRDWIETREIRLDDIPDDFE